MLLRRRPFVPFRLILSSGDRIVVRHPELATVDRNKIIVESPDAEGQLPEMPTTIAVFHIVGFEPASQRDVVTDGK